MLRKVKGLNADLNKVKSVKSDPVVNHCLTCLDFRPTSISIVSQGVATCTPPVHLVILTVSSTAVCAHLFAFICADRVCVLPLCPALVH